MRQLIYTPIFDLQFAISDLNFLKFLNLKGSVFLDFQSKILFQSKIANRKSQILLFEVGSNLLEHPFCGALMLPEKLVAPLSHFFSCSFVLEETSHVAGKILYPIGLNRSSLLDQPARDL